jgi:hypothetical protein
MYKTTTMKKTQ